MMSSLASTHPTVAAVRRRAKRCISSPSIESMASAGMTRPGNSENLRRSAVAERPDAEDGRGL